MCISHHFIVSLSPSLNWEGEKKENNRLSVQSKLPMLIYSEMLPRGATNPLGFLTGPSERQITLLLGRREKWLNRKRGEERWYRKSSVSQTSCKRKRQQIRGGRFQVGVREEVELLEKGEKRKRDKKEMKTWAQREVDKRERKIVFLGEKVITAVDQSDS